MRNHVAPRLLPPALVAAERWGGWLTRPNRIKDYGEGLPPS